MNSQNVLTVTNFEEAKEIYRHKDFKQALYDAGEVVMEGVLVNLHGDEHRARRRLENRLFRRETLVHYERDLFPQVISETLEPFVQSGRTALTRIFRGPSSVANTFTNASRAPLVAAYGAAPGYARTVYTDPIKMIAPSVATRCGSAT